MSKIYVLKWRKNSMKQWILDKMQSDNISLLDAYILLEDEIEPYDKYGRKQYAAINESITKLAKVWLEIEIAREKSENKYPYKELNP